MASDAQSATRIVVDPTPPDCNPDPTFNEVHPPRMCFSDKLPPERSTLDLIGKFVITSADFERVNDPDYPWQQYVDYVGNPAAFEKMKQIKTAQLAEVKQYVVTRYRYWRRQDPVEYPENTSIMITAHHGLTTHHGQTQDMSITQTISIGLGLNFSAPLGGEPIPPVPMARAASDAASESDEGPSGGSGLHFSYDFSKTLHITQTDEATYTDERTEQVSMDYKGGFLYIPWDLAEDLVLERLKSKDGSVLEHAASMTGLTKRKQFQKFRVEDEETS